MSDTRRYIDQALTDNGLVELRHQDGKRWVSGLFDNADNLLSAAGNLHQAGNLFVSLNRPAPRAAINRMGSEPLCNDDIQWFTRLFFDFDPIRPKDCPSTQDELALAQRSAVEARKIFKAMAWPDPLAAISGNGAHLLYRTHLPNTAEIRDMLGVIYTGLREDYSSEQTEFDRSVRNPGRIGPLYGSYKRKGVSTPERPHRQSRIVSWPREWRQVSRQSLDGVANFYACRHQSAPAPDQSHRSVTLTSGYGDYSTLDIVAWFTAHGLYEHHITDIIHAVQCPWEGEHSETHRNDTIIYANDDGSWPGFHCKHSHCEGRSIRDVMDVMGDADQFCAQQWGGRHV